MSLRDYQGTCVSNIGKVFAESDSAMAVMPTGTGKTHVFSNVIAKWPQERGRVLVLAHRGELLRQAQAKIDLAMKLHGDESGVGFEMGNLTTVGEYSLFGSQQNKCVVASVQSMHLKRLKKFRPEDFGLVVVDECHHAVKKNKTYWTAIKYFLEGGCKVLGVTATPDRNDEEALGGIFKKVAFSYDIGDAIQDGWLVPVYQEMVHVSDLDLSQVKTNMGDLAPGQLNDILAEEKMCHKVVGPSLEIVGDRKTMIFGAGCKQSEKMADIINRHKPGSALYIDGGTPPDERIEELKRFARGDYQFLVSCHVFTEGYDEPTVECVVQARPTKSRMLYAQMAGRGTRVLPGVVEGVGSPPDWCETEMTAGGVWRIKSAEDRRKAIEQSAKPKLLLIDFVGNAGRHKLVYAGDMLGGHYTDEEIQEANKQAQENTGPVEVSEALVKAKKVVEEERRKVLADVVAKAEYKRRSIDPFDVLDLSSKREPGWHKGRQPTEKMVAMIKRAKVPLVFDQGRWFIGEESMAAEARRPLTFWKAKELITEIVRRRDKGLCTFAQAKILRKYNQNTEVSFHQASAMINKIAARGWRR